MGGRKMEEIENKSERSNRSSRLLNNTMLLTVGTIFTKCISLVMVVFYSRWLTSGEYGDYELYVTYLSLLIPVSTLSCGEAIFRFLLEKDSVSSKKLIISSAISIAFGGFALTILLIRVFVKELFADYFIEFIILLVIQTFFTVAQYCARGLHKLKNYTIASIINAFVMAVATTFFVCFQKLGLHGMLLGNICGYLVGLLFCIISLRLYSFIDIRSISLEEIKMIAKYSAPLIPNSIAWWIAEGSDRTIVRINLGSEYNGIYSLANKIPALCITLFNMFHLSWQESASDAIKDDTNAGEYFNGVFKKLVPTLLSISIAVLSTNYFFYKYIFDVKYSDGYYHVAILTFATVFSFMAQFIGGIFIGLKRTTVNGITTAMAALVNIIIDLVLINNIGLYAASISTLLSYAFLFFVRVLLVRKDYQIELDRTSVIYFFVFIYFIVMQYINIDFMHYVNLVIAVTIFLFTNKKLVFTILARVKRK